MGGKEWRNEMTQCTDFLPSERVRVFISSAQSQENGFAWTDVRRKIKDALKSCVYFNPFIIEDEASATPSNQFFQRQVERADVVVILVKGEVRKGTAIEYELAAKLKKPLLVYFIDDDTPNVDVDKLKDDIESGDKCTYHRVSSFESIELIVRSDLINEIVRTFQDKYYTPYNTEEVENLGRIKIKSRFLKRHQSISLTAKQPSKK